jgi:hypothetical protein
MTPTHAPGYLWTRTRCLPMPLPRYTWIDKDDTLWVGIHTGLVVCLLRTVLEALTNWLHALALFLAGMALVDAWQRRRVRGVIVGRLEDLKPRQMELPLAG